MTAELLAKIQAAHDRVASALLSELGTTGHKSASLTGSEDPPAAANTSARRCHWSGELSASALSTATAVIALAAMNKSSDSSLIARGLQWLEAHANADGGWGDTIRSKSNLSTTALVWAAFGAANADDRFRITVTHAARYLQRAIGADENLAVAPDSRGLVRAIEARYGDDRTFSVPIVMALALAERLGPDGWRLVRPLPFELAALPRALFGALRLPVVSYALPALIAIGQVIHFRARRFNFLRTLTRKRTLDLLITLQPDNGGFLEAIPLTSFVTMSLAGMGEENHIVAQRGAGFLRQSVRQDGSWPIDTTLCTWVTTLAVKALRFSPGALTPEHRSELRAWLLGQQYRREHAYTGAAPGGWAWCDLPGGVPDADDTAGALVALDLLRDGTDAADEEVRDASSAGARWLLGLQNSDGGIPTFCRGWGRLPFDRSAPELTVHAIRAWMASMRLLPAADVDGVTRAISRACDFIVSSQRPDGDWVPLWFGNEHAPGEENPVYGTAQVLVGLEAIEDSESLSAARRRGYEFLRRAQNADGGWGGACGAPSTIEETGLALEALAAEPVAHESITRGAEWLIAALADPASIKPAPIGLYFAKLWYFEKLYPLIFACNGLGRLLSGSA